MKKMLLIVLCLCVAKCWAQSRSISGKVVDSLDNPIAKASIAIKGSRGGTYSNEDGSFTLTVPGTAKALVVTAVGFVENEVRIGSGNTLQVVMKRIDHRLEDIVVVAYGTARKSTYTGSAVQINADKIASRPLTNVIKALDGLAPGVQASSGTGQPGEAPSIRIRGFGSVNASNAPLYVVDGVPYMEGLQNLNSDDIESISVLKDAASTAMYGSKAANGVIIITTKRGRKDQNKLQIRVVQGVSERSIPEYNRVAAGSYYPLMWEALRNNYISTGSTTDNANQKATNNIKNYLYYNPFNVPDNEIVGVDGKLNSNASLIYANDLDWYSPILRTGNRGDYGISYSGGTDKNDYFVSLGYLKDNGYLKKTDYERVTGRISANSQIRSWLKTGLNISGTISKSNYAATADNSTGYSNPFFFSRNIGPIYPVYVHDMKTGDFVLDESGNRIFDFGNNNAEIAGYPAQRPSGASPGRHIVAETQWNNQLYKSNTLSGRTYMEIPFLRDFKFTTNLSADVTSYNSSFAENRFVGDGAPAGRLQKRNYSSTSINFNQLLRYSKSFHGHAIEALVGHESYKYLFSNTSGLKQSIGVDGNDEFINYSTINSLTSYSNEYHTEGYLARVDYSYRSKYFGSASFRKDGSSVFYKPWGSFWSLGAGWRMDQEDFLKSVKWVNLLKLRASYGETGNDFILNSDGSRNYYAYQELSELGVNNGNNFGILKTSKENKDLTWENNKSFDLGVEFSVFENRFNGSVEFFNRQSDNLLFAVRLPLSGGLISEYQNVGTMKNYGVEAQLNGVVIQNKDFKWSLGANVTFLKNTITKLNEDSRKNGIINGTKKLLEGHSLYDYWLRSWYGVDVDNGDALWKMDPAANFNSADCKIIKGDTVTSNYNKALYEYNGSAIPKFYGGITSSFNYKNFDLAILLTYQVGGKVYDGNYSQLMHSGNFGTAWASEINGRWQKSGDITNIPRLDYSKRSVYDVQSSRWLVDGSYLNVKSISLGYTLPQRLLGKAEISSLRAFVSAENIWMFTAHKGMNPQQAFTGVASNDYIPARMLQVGLNVNF
ncbi:SusC/RagA family TonB-linked outer membrane protein [Danxiaibacter flavus]|uniref:SusC/RagA family TonB-linked outer membrane protein n=1 Tax=Danxiaibacter flavus TaxID=3049108 RepID=A0ABV3Z9Q8_9BACT|nr:SusC/RagA family TonB-linked outer membrane protein [Chitinophagaceae bacterium DXS]